MGFRIAMGKPVQLEEPHAMQDGRANYLWRSLSEDRQGEKKSKGKTHYA